jgi:hypothetical protein
MRASWKTTAVTTALAAATLLSACSGNGGFDEASASAGESSAEGGDALGQTEQAWTMYYPTCASASSDPDGDGWGWENNQSCKVSTTSTSTTTTTTSSSCPNPDGTNSVMAALAVATAKELRRWEPLTDFFVSSGELRLTSAGRSRCGDGICRNTQALLDMQKPISEGQVKVSPTVTLSASALRSRLAAKFGEQAACESRPDNHNGSDCPAEDHNLRFLYSAKGSCDMDFWFEATKVTGGPLQYPAQLKNKLLWVDTHNPYVNFQSSGSTVSIDPTYGLNEDSTSTAGSCTPACTKVSASSVIGACCTCNGTKKFQRSLFNPYIYFCR